jgi:hypothetical protein
MLRRRKQWYDDWCTRLLQTRKEIRSEPIILDSSLVIPQNEVILQSHYVPFWPERFIPQEPAVVSMELGKVGACGTYGHRARERLTGA